MKKVVMLLILVVFMFGCSDSKELDFDSAVWKKTESFRYQKDDITKRQKMIKSVLKLIKGKSKAEIVGLLGKSLDSGYFKSTGRDSIYILGPERSYISVDSEWLLLWFDKKNILVKFEITTD